MSVVFLQFWAGCSGRQADTLVLCVLQVPLFTAEALLKSQGMQSGRGKGGRRGEGRKKRGRGGGRVVGLNRTEF